MVKVALVAGVAVALSFPAVRARLRHALHLCGQRMIEEMEFGENPCCQMCCEMHRAMHRRMEREAEATPIES